MIPLFPYMILGNARRAVLVSVVVTMTARDRLRLSSRDQAIPERPLRSVLHTAV